MGEYLGSRSVISGLPFHRHLIAGVFWDRILDVGIAWQLVN